MTTFLSDGKRKFDCNESAMEFLGPEMPPRQAQAIAEGLINPSSKTSVEMPSSKYAIPAFTAELENKPDYIKKSVSSFNGITGKKPDWLNNTGKESKENRRTLLAPPPTTKLCKIDDIVSQYNVSSSNRSGLAPRKRLRNAFTKTPCTKANSRENREKFSRRSAVKSPFQEATMSGSFLSVNTKVNNVMLNPARNGFANALGIGSEAFATPTNEEVELEMQNTNGENEFPISNNNSPPLPDQEPKREIHLSRRILRPLMKSARKSARTSRKVRRRNKSGVWNFGLDGEQNDHDSVQKGLKNRPCKKRRVDHERLVGDTKKQRAVQGTPVTRKAPCSPDPGGGAKKLKSPLVQSSISKTKVKQVKKKENTNTAVKQTGKKQRNIMSFFGKAK